jgi:broad specificity phosphatase PhoE
VARLLLVRHGVTDYNTNHRFAGFSDVDLSEQGYRQVELLGERLAGEKIDAVYSSDLKRAVATARAAVNSHDIEITRRPELREMNYGVAEGMTFDELQQAHPDIAESIIHFNTGICFPEGETFEGFISRSCSFLEELKNHGRDETVLIVSHGGVLKVLVCDLLGIDHSHWPQIRFDNASLSIVDTYGERVILSLLNDTSHLGEPGLVH